MLEGHRTMTETITFNVNQPSSTHHFWEYVSQGLLGGAFSFYLDYSMITHSLLLDGPHP